MHEVPRTQCTLTCVCVCARLAMCMPVCMYACVRAWIHAHMHVRSCIRLLMHLCVPYKRARMSACLCIFMCASASASLQDSIMNGTPQEDFGGGHPDPNLT